MGKAQRSAAGAGPASVRVSIPPGRKCLGPLWIASKMPRVIPGFLGDTVKHLILLTMILALAGLRGTLGAIFPSLSFLPFIEVEPHDQECTGGVVASGPATKQAEPSG